MAQQGKPQKKFLVMGLDNTGKTSIIHCLEGNENLLSLFKFPPTLGHEIRPIETSDTLYSIWDFGGQEEYRKLHLKNLDKRLSGADKLIYVIDVQDKKRYEIALNYFEDIVRNISDIGTEVSVFLHKYDPQLETGKHMAFSLDDVATLIDSIQERARKYAPKVRLKIFKTTIYTVFEKVPVFA